MSSRARMTRHDSIDSKTPRRQANACLRCYEKKVKCDMDSLGQPCTGCARDGINCQKRTRKPYPPRKESSNASSKANSSRSSPSRDSVVSSCPIPMPTPPRSIPSDTLPTPMFNSEPFHFPASYLESAPAEFYNPMQDFSHMTAHPAGDDVPMTENMMPFFNGSGHDQQYSYLLDVCNPEQDPTLQHFMALNTATSALDAAALNFAEARGCFTMPNHTVCEDLIQCYFHYVHPTLPIMNIADFLEQYTGGSFEQTSLLLLWSMFSVAANFASDSTLALSGCTTRQELKKLMSARAKCLFDLEYEQDRITQIQSALLLGYWHSDVQDHAQAWHWTGIAISTAQIIGLHREPSVRLGGPVSASRRQVWMNLWWCCFMRDRWLSFGHGRPLRIDSADCDVPMVGADCMMDLPERAPQTWRKYVPQNLRHLAPIWTGLLKLTLVLGDIISATYQPHRAPLDVDGISDLERRVSECLPEKQAHPLHPEVLQFFESHARLHVEATIIALFRPYATEFSANRAKSVDSAVAQLANGRIKASATRASGILDRIISNDTLRFAGPIMVPLLVPSMTVHLMQARSHDQFTSSWSKNRLELSLMVLKRLEENYPAASQVHQLFSAQTKDEQHNTGQFNMASLTPPASFDHQQHVNPMSHWQPNPLDLRASLNTAISCPTTQWDSPELEPGLDLWTLSPPDGKMFFPLDDLHASSL